MKIYSTVFFLLLGTLLSKAQDTLLPQGKCTIYLHSEKAYKNVSLWKIDTNKVEYVKNGNLSDVLTSSVEKIETPTYYIEFDEQHKMLRKQYDVILPFHKDSIFCTIISVNDLSIVYRPLGGNRNKTIPKFNVKYFNKGSESETIKNEYKAIISDRSAGADSISTNKNYKLVAKKNAKKYFRGRPAFIGGLVSGILFPYGWVSAGIIAAVPPTRIYELEYPNSEILNNNETYTKEFRKEAHKIKAKKVALGFGIGMAAVFVTAILVVVATL